MLLRNAWTSDRMRRDSTSAIRAFPASLNNLDSPWAIACHAPLLLRVFIPGGYHDEKLAVAFVRNL